MMQAAAASNQTGLGLGSQASANKFGGPGGRPVGFGGGGAQGASGFGV